VLAGALRLALFQGEPRLDEPDAGQCAIDAEGQVGGAKASEAGVGYLDECRFGSRPEDMTSARMDSAAAMTGWTISVTV
jgi:hypothetical protein